jgi:hypothetical protein
MATANVSPCVVRFVRTVLCGNPIMKGAFVTTLSSVVLALDAEIAILFVLLQQLNIVKRVIDFAIQSVRATLNQVAASLNIVLGPLQTAAECEELRKLLTQLESSAVGRKVRGMQNLIYKANRISGLAVQTDSIMKYKNKVRDDLLDMISAINTLCP